MITIRIKTAGNIDRSVDSMASFSDLPPDLLCDFSGRLHAAADVVRFHAVCRDWRAALDYRQPRPHPPPALLPLLLAPAPAPTRVSHADGTASWFVDGRFVDLLTAMSDTDAAERYECDWIDHGGFSHRIVSGDGAFHVHRLSEDKHVRGRLSLDGVTWCPGKKRNKYRRRSAGSWVPKRLGSVDTGRCCAVAYHDDATLCVDLRNCYIYEKHLDQLGHRSFVRLPDEPGKARQCSYLLEFRGELLLASVLQDAGGRRLSVSVHALDLDAALLPLDFQPAAEQAWERRDSADLGDLVLFLGYPGSFAVEAVRFREEVPAGSAYFVVKSEPCRVYRYSFVDDAAAATLVDTLPAGWNDERCMWFLPDPMIAPVRPRAKTAGHGGETQEEEQAPGSHRRRDLTIYAGDLHPRVDSSQLRAMFSKHGRVARARVATDKWGRSREYGVVTMATQSGFDNAIAADGDAPENVCTYLTFLVLLLLVNDITARFNRLIVAWIFYFHFGYITHVRR
ncbi:uncharacterized protein LOC121053470 [Oryza brachyantha]|uniref:uncharacterized protein LOC121053470 n=1 Tax=Oryza brachyantha TaxID=4533 RepID=UPI001ADB180F|nr:uncharacterized protein LOC121053470 [Oryza brachyantha]